jgi:hypothetical protein
LLLQPLLKITPLMMSNQWIYKNPITFKLKSSLNHKHHHSLGLTLSLFKEFLWAKNSSATVKTISALRGTVIV